MNFLGNLQVFFFVFFIFCVRRSIDVINPENQPRSGFIRTGYGSRALGLTEDVWHQKYENKKEGLQNYLEYSFYSILTISHRSGYTALDPEFDQNRIRNTAYLDRIPKPVYTWSLQTGFLSDSMRSQSNECCKKHGTILTIIVLTKIKQKKIMIF